MTRKRTTTERVILWGAFGALLYVAHEAFIPVALALLFGLILSGPVEALHRIRVSRSLGAALILVVVLSAGLWR
jgi:predicted PurR-regulated permease PerM